jgi:hypothetical protein
MTEQPGNAARAHADEGTPPHESEAPQHAEAPRDRPSLVEFDCRVGPKPRHRSFAAMLRAEPLRALRWLALGPGGGQDAKRGRIEHADFFQGPVRWLFGRDLLVHMRSIALYSAFGAELDHRDWMQADVIDLSAQPCEEGAFWFDYLADSGDGQLAMYNLACLVLGDLFLDEATPGARVSLRLGRHRLPRGRFLFMGGDTAYHVADDATLEGRVCTPFHWAKVERDALQDVSSERGHPAQSGFRSTGDPGPRLLFGIPGNHDYYDSLIGFNRLLRAPDNRRLPVADLQRRQQASFAALRLPFDWCFLGLDSQAGKLDRRQQAFMAGLLRSGAGKRLIVATPEPATVFDATQPQAAQPFAALGLPRPFIDPAATSDRRRLPDADAIHLDLAGDVHHYARYAEAAAPNYAYIVSGGGGAFVHPTETTHAPRGARRPAWPPPAQRYYPDRATSNREITLRLLCPWRILGGGAVMLLGGLFATLLYFGAMLGPGTHDLFTSEVVPRLPLSAPEVSARSALQIASPVVNTMDRIVTADADSRYARSDLSWHEWLALGLLLLTLAAGVASRRTFARASEPEDARHERPVVPARSYAGLCALAIATLASLSLTYALRSTSAYPPLPSPLLADLLLMVYLLPLPLSLLWTVGYLATLPKQAKSRPLTQADSVPRWIVLVFGMANAVFGLLAYGVNSAAAFASDCAAMAAVFMLGAAPIFAGAMQGVGRGLVPKLGYAALGLWFGALQLAIPLLLALQGSALSTCAALLWPLACAGLALPLQRRVRSAWPLLGLWLLAGLGAVALALWLGHPAPVSGSRFLLAFFSGGIFSCIWFGWYLAVSLGFNAHNNEAGGAARLDAYRHFIRFKLEPDRLTGYVIGFDRPEEEDAALKVRLIERFELTPRGAGGAADATT